MNNFRKRVFVNPAIQGRLLSRIALYWLLYHAMLWMSMFLYRFAEHRGEMLAGAPARTFGDLYGEFVRGHFSLWVCSAAILPIVLFDALKFSHRVVGPLVQFQRTIKNLTTGQQVGRIRLREGDLLQELQDSFNQYLGTLRTLRPEYEAQKATTPVHDEVIAMTAEQQIACELQQIQNEFAVLNAEANARAIESGPTSPVSI